MRKPVIAVFCMFGVGHFRQLLPIISDLGESGFTVYVFTHRHFHREVDLAGGTPVDLFARHSVEDADSESVPIPSRWVSFAAAYADEIVEELRQIRPALILYETFAVIGRLAAQVLGIPFVNVSAGHNVDPARYLPVLLADPRVAISDRCHQAVETLRERYDLHDASPFSYVTGLSPYLNICSQPPEFLTENDREVFEPVAFYGCLPSRPDQIELHPDPAHFDHASGGITIFACLGTNVRHYYEDAALGVLQAVAECVGGMPDARALISLGGSFPGDGSLRRLARSNVVVVDYADQWSALAAADVFVTHHGINSTHEAIFHRVPMLSYPFFWDQPALAAKCHEFGIALPLAETPRGPVTAGGIQSGLAQVLEKRDMLRSNLTRARDWERAVIARRGTTLQMIKDLV